LVIRVTSLGAGNRGQDAEALQAEESGKTKPQTTVTPIYSSGMSQIGSFSSYLLRVLRMVIT
jgi:hypothetical protein